MEQEIKGASDSHNYTSFVWGCPSGVNLNTNFEFEQGCEFRSFLLGTSGNYTTEEVVNWPTLIFALDV